MDTENLSWNDNLSNRRNSPLLPHSIRGIIVGKSGCGKTNLLLNLLLKQGWLDYDNLQFFRKSLFQLEYKIVKAGFEQNLPKEILLNLFETKDVCIKNSIAPQDILREAGKLYSTKSPTRCCFYKKADDVPDPKDLKTVDKKLMIFNDFVLEKENKCENYYFRGRHSNVDCFYLAQNYFKLPRQTIREIACLFYVFV